MSRLLLQPPTGPPPRAADYERDRATMLAALLAAGADAVYEIGSLRAPGISDIDLVACFPDTQPASAFAPLQRHLANRPPSFLHAPWGLCNRHMASLSALFAVRHMHNLRDGTERLVQQSAAERFAWNVEACAATLSALAGRGGRTTARSALCLLNGITYNLDLAAADGIAAPSGADFALCIEALRAHWFIGAPANNEQELARLWQLAPAILRELLVGYARRIPRLLGSADDDAGLLPVPGTRLTYCFTDGEPTRRVLSNPLTTVVALPSGLLPLFRRLAAPGNGLDRFLTLTPEAPRAPAPATAPDPAFATAIDDYAQRNATYLGDMLRIGSPLMRLNGGTLAHAGERPAGLIARLAQAPWQMLRRRLERVR